MSSPEDDYSNVPTPEPLPDISDINLAVDFPKTDSPLEIMREVRASIVSNFLKKGAIGAGVGVALSLGIFRRRSQCFPHFNLLKFRTCVAYIFHNRFCPRNGIRGRQSVASADE